MSNRMQDPVSLPPSSGYEGLHSLKVALAAARLYHGPLYPTASPCLFTGIPYLARVSRIISAIIMIIRLVLFLSLVVILFSGCGDASALKGYRYHTTKYRLEEAVMKVIRNNPSVVQDTATENTWGPSNTAYSKDGRHDIAILVRTPQAVTSYVLTYLGNETNWKTQSDAEIFISQLRDKDGNSIRQGENENGQFSGKTAKDGISLFETVFIAQLDRELHLPHQND